MNPYTWGRGDTRRLSTRDFPAAVLALVDARLGGRFCVDCRAAGIVTPDDVPLEVDHLQPLALGGTNEHINLTWRCRSHNRGRGARRDAPPVPRWMRVRKASDKHQT